MELREEIIQKLQENQDLKYRDFHSGLCPGTVNIIGVRIPVQRKVAREIIRGDWRRFLHEAKNEFYEESMIEGLVIATAKMELAERLEWLRKFVPKIDNWAVCDSVCASFKFKPEVLPEIWEFLDEYEDSTREFELRFRLIMMLDNFLTDEYTCKVLDAVRKIKSEAYYVRMAQAWLVAETFAKYREPTLVLLQEKCLPDWVQNKAIQKIRESYRVSAADKELVRTLKV